MFHSYEEALNWIHSRLRFGIKPGLTRMEMMMEKLNHPEKQIKTVHIGGTNGKGSTVTYLRNILQQAGLTVGTFTSPYIEQFNERISVNGKPISDEEILSLANKLFPIVEEMDKMEIGGPTEFEIITAMSFYYFAYMNKMDIVIYEVGLGGRFDSTNIISPLLSIITSIGLDHTAILGDTYAQIAFEKAGIIKKETPIIAAVKQTDAQNVIVKQANEMEAPIYLLDKDFTIDEYYSRSTCESFVLKSPLFRWTDLQITMFGKHQVENASLAVIGAQLLRDMFESINEDSIRKGLFQSKWPGRFEIISKSPFVVVDGAHNEEGVEALVDVLVKRYPEKNINIIFAALSDKKTDKMIAKLDQVATTITFVTFDYPRASPSTLLYEESNHLLKEQNDNWKEAILKQLERLEEENMLLITGSLYFISEVKAFWKNFKK
ncbi:bifunctional folylpolyglutamate synthase/dihydrofolate synthase [Cytobacillus oceanisediminis]|uniref:Dihydrofolate synthase/folylpolyglutamate synthase n=1 Tax=Niallia circulans TaxID=1397 RepID=A0A941JJZ9_NIACI|nr:MULTISPECIES: folylpolyglutamate synthase/dihydrofolate synthase family protein [Bacillaceae]EOR25513.1 FolC bifunctional protein [Niallia nealsonii AAU1]MBZ9533582.1 bifunctional folylpolyglutamate synthase/dihydrofolate synthase [Cytobacillus oceanisediminis]MCB5235618.1 bifunctional folylpolyglutamate synthase/dihydrofolate synthase [Niallia circulans]MED3791703.1 bifunctional folylpolyglutamate synthase/dihydrofolate synthase [Niallia alba]